MEAETNLRMKKLAERTKELAAERALSEKARRDQLSRESTLAIQFSQDIEQYSAGHGIPLRPTTVNGNEITVENGRGEMIKIKVVDAEQDGSVYRFIYSSPMVRDRTHDENEILTEVLGWLHR
jgi:hypothetical protein